MAYNHGREDRKWRIWKEAEEKVMRECGVDETVIEQIRIEDRADFNSNRRFYRWTSDFGEYLEGMADTEPQAEPNTVADLLDEIEDEKVSGTSYSGQAYPAHSPAENAGVFHKGDCGGGRAYRKGGLQTP